MTMEISAPDKTLICLRETWPWMSQVSGFDPLFSSIERAEDRRVRSLFVPKYSKPQSLARRVLKRLAKPNQEMGTLGFSLGEPRHESAARELLADLKAQPEALAILSAAENQYGFALSNSPLPVRARLVACFHQPPSWWRLHWSKATNLEGLRAVVCLSSEQQKYFSSVSAVPTILIRHGVCLDFFTPPAVGQEHVPRLLFVGQWLRDFETLHASMEIIWRKNPRVELDCVVPRHARNNSAIMRLARNAAVRWHATSTPTICALFIVRPRFYFFLSSMALQTTPLSRHFPAVCLSFLASFPVWKSMFQRHAASSPRPALRTNMRRL